MDQDLQIIETILRYLEDKMDAAEREAFENSLKSDQSLSKEVELYRKAKLGFDGLKAEEFAKTLTSWEAEAAEASTTKPDNVKDISSGKGRSGRGIFPLLAMAASLVATVLVFWFLLQPSGVLSAEEILASYTPEHKMPLIRDAGGTEHRLKEGIQAYMEQRYNDAAIYFETISVTDEQYTDAQMYLGYAWFESGQFEKAIGAFANVKNAASPRFGDKADWFMALSYLAAGNDIEWEANLKRIAEDKKHQYNKEAVEIMAPE